MEIKEVTAVGPYEIERKYLIARPDEAWLCAQPGCRRARITQTYLLAGDGEERRVRRREEDGACLYVETIKRPVTAVRREEIEREITREEYEALLAQADPACRPIEKTRWMLPCAGLTLEIDVYPFWADRAILEAEIDREDAPIAFPPGLAIIREVTDDPDYKNASLARNRRV